MSEEQTESKEMTIDVALLIYKNFRMSIAETSDRLISPYQYDSRGKAHKRKSEAVRLTDLTTLSLVVKAVAGDINPNPDQFENEKAKQLYGQMMAVAKAKEVIKADMRSKLLSNDDSVSGVSEELKQKVLKEM
jgi:hypothetical protein